MYIKQILPKTNLFSRKCFSIALFCFVVNLLLGQNLVFNFQHINSNDGLTGRYNSFIKKDSKGLVWISSMNGIYLFDGLETKLLNSSDYEGLASDNIQSSFFEDNENNIWFTTLNAINCYNRKNDSFFAIQLKDKKGNYISNEYHLFHIDKKRNTLWLKANEVIFEYNIKEGIYQEITETKGFRFAVDTFSNGTIKTIIACPWINHSGVEMISFTEERKVNKKHLFEFGLSANDRTQIEISNALIESDSIFYFFSNLGLIKYELKGSTFQLLELPKNLSDAVKGGTFIDHENILAITKNSGLITFNIKNDSLINYQSTGLNNSISSNSLLTIYLDYQNHLWLANTYAHAIDYLYNKEDKFKNPFIESTSQNPIINKIIEDKEGNIWCASVSKGIFKFNRDGSEVRQYSKEQNSNGKTRPFTVRHFSKDINGDVWAIGNQFIYFLNGSLWQPIFDLQEINANAHCLLHINNELKLLSTNKGVFELSYKNKTPKSKSLELISKLNESIVFNLFKDDKNIIYLPTDENILLLYRYAHEKIKLIKELNINADIYCFKEEPTSNSLLLGTSNGLFRLNEDKDSIAKILEDSLPIYNAQVYSIHSDKRGYYWLITSHGVWRYKNNPFELNSFPTDNNQFTLYSNIQKKNGEIWIGTGQGAVKFFPDSINPYPFKAKLHIKSLEVNQKRFESDKVLDEIKNFEFDYFQNTLAFKIVGVSNYKPKFVKINYQLEGYDDEWQTIENGGILKFLKLPPGSYKLNLYSQNANGIKGEMKRMDIEITPPFWQRCWFYLLCILLAALSIYRLNKYLTHKKLKQQAEKFREEQETIRRQQELNEFLQDERNRIAADMHDDLGSGLNSINILIQSIKSQSIPEELFKKLNKVQLKTVHLVDNMREIIWAMDGNYDNLPDLVAYIRLYAVDYFDEQELPFDARLPGELPPIAVSSKKRRNIFLCIKEAINNIIKHANATHVSLTFTYDNISLEITLKDNGKGIEKDNKNRFGNGLRNMRTKMEKIGGKFTIEDEEGTKLTFKIPISNDNIIKSDTLKITQNGKKNY